MTPPRLAVALLALLLTACAAARPRYDFDAERRTTSAYVVGPGDILQVRAWKNDALSQRVTVRPDGYVTLPLIGEVMAGGREVREIASEVSARAAALMRKGGLRLSKTVLLETEWVLRYTYEYDAPSINRALSTLIGLDDLTVEDAQAVRAVIAWHAAGVDFAGALHLASAGPAPRFATFDRKLAKKVRPDWVCEILSSMNAGNDLVKNLRVY